MNPSPQKESQMNDFEIDKALALAIGHKVINFRNDCRILKIYVYDEIREVHHFRIFSHKDPAVILPIVKKLGLSMAQNKHSKKWFEAKLCCGYFEDGHESYDTAAALAVIELAKESA